MEHDAPNPAATGQAVGMPQLDVSSFPNQIFWAAVALVVIYLILARVALPRIGAVLAERRGTITNDIAAAEDLKRRAQEAEDAYTQALADARSEAARIVAESKAEMQKELDAAQEKADAEIAAKSAESEKRIEEIRDTAMDSVQQVARDVAREVVTAFGHTAEARRIDSAVDTRLKDPRA